jgi:hypothetical protein
MKRREGKPKGKGGRRENTIDFHRILYSQLPRYIVFYRPVFDLDKTLPCAAKGLK